MSKDNKTAEELEREKNNQDDDLEDDDLDEEADADDDDSDDDDDDDSEDDGEIADDKPIDGKTFKKFQKDILNTLGTIKRHSIKQSKESKRSPAYQRERPRNDKDGPETKTSVAQLVQKDRIRDYAEDNGITIKEARHVFSIVPNPTKKTLRDPFIAGGLERMRQVNSTDENIPTGSSARVFKVEGKPWNELTPEQKKENFPARQQFLLSQKGKR